MFDQGDNITGLNSLTLFGVEIACQHIAFDPCQFRLPNQFFPPCLGKFRQRHAQKPFPSPDLTDHCQSAQIHVSNRVADNPLTAYSPQQLGWQVGELGGGFHVRSVTVLSVQDCIESVV